jgi:hypothetical protein
MIRRYDDYDVLKRQEKVCHMHNMRLINWFPRTPLACMFYHVEPDNDLANRCVPYSCVIILDSQTTKD